MNEYRILWRGLRWVSSTSLLAAGYLAGLTIASSTASEAASDGHIVVKPPASIASTACQAEIMAYAVAYGEYTSAVEILNASYDALYECQHGGSGGGGEPDEPEEPEHYAELAKLPSVLEEAR